TVLLTALVVSADVLWAAATVGVGGYVGPPRLSGFPSVPDTCHIRTRLASLSVETLRVVHLRLWEGPWASDRSGCTSVPNDRETAPITKVSRIENGEHH